jgi:subtilisin family serine protease
MMIRKILATVTMLLIVNFLSAQYSFRSDQTKVALPDTILKAPANWFNLDYELDKVRGISTEKAYKELLVGKKTKTIIVAIIDSGIDIEHEDLKDKIWINTKEIAGNGIDDDKNGYIDDINGWDFIGNAKGEMINYDNLEVTRLYSKLKKIYDGKSANDFKGKQLEEYNYYLELKADYDNELKKAESTYGILTSFKEAYEKANEVLKKELKKDDYTLEEVQAIQSEDPDIQKAKQVLSTLSLFNLTPEALIEGYDYYKAKVEFELNLDFDPRSLVGDNYSNPNEKFYGNNIVEGPDAFHGTHVAGIIGANRDNQIGIKGIASNIKIMVLRTVPNGDERDKDVANSIYYAADNGAKVINMSFGKYYSPNKDVVDKAIQYAEKKGVLFIHAAGNDSYDIDGKKHYPCSEYLNKQKKCNSWIEVGASSWKDNNEFVADFSNYGQNSVDVFAPGVDIYSSVTDNKYKSEGGTSMAAPMVTGLAALIWSYYPNLTATDIKKIILESSVKYTNELVNKPGDGSSIEFGKLSNTGGLINAYQALKMAETYKK